MARLKACYRQLSRRKSDAQRRGAAHVNRCKFQVKELLWRVCAGGHISPNGTLLPVGVFGQQTRGDYKPDPGNSLLSFCEEPYARAVDGD